MHPTLTLIGMPGAGKSTLGQRLAENLGMPFTDTDQLLEQQQGPLQPLIDRLGPQAFSQLEEKVLTLLRPGMGIIATGGSAVYSEAGMKHLKSLGPVIYLWASFDDIERRIHNLNQRGLVRQPGQSLNDLFNERDPLYRRYADHLLDTSKGDLSQLTAQLTRLLPS